MVTGATNISAKAAPHALTVWFGKAMIFSSRLGTNSQTLFSQGPIWPLSLSQIMMHSHFLKPSS